jgi:hypothetical protein
MRKTPRSSGLDKVRRANFGNEEAGRRIFEQVALQEVFASVPAAVTPDAENGITDRNTRIWIKIGAAEWEYWPLVKVVPRQ